MKITLPGVAQAYLTVITAPLIVLFVARLLMTPAWLYFEYTREGFPADLYGFTTDERLEYGRYAIRYLLNGEEVEYLGGLSFPDGGALYTANELGHMRDVKVLTQIAFAAAVIAGLIACGALLYLRADPYRVAAGLRNGALLTVGIILAIAAATVFNWEFFFTGFHQLFFPEGNWQFAYSDTLIRLFPEQFWFDSALTIGGLTILSAITLFFITYRVKSG
jgi:integral membrane protein (TIGR01906 family)